MRLFLLILVLLSTGCAQFELSRPERDRWSKFDTTRQMVIFSMESIDHIQASGIKYSPGEEEMNPLLGPHPSDERLKNFYLIRVTGSTAVSYYLPRDYRDVWQWGYMIFSFYTIFDNERNHKRPGG